MLLTLSNHVKLFTYLNTLHLCYYAQSAKVSSKTPPTIVTCIIQHHINIEWFVLFIKQKSTVAGQKTSGMVTFSERRPH